jgi:hypothetical protein
MFISVGLLLARGLAAVGGEDLASHELDLSDLWDGADCRRWKRWGPHPQVPIRFEDYAVTAALAPIGA